MDFESIFNITPLDGRYKEEVKELGLVLSEYALMKNRVGIEAEHLISLSDLKIYELKDEEKKLLRKLYSEFSPQDFKTIEEIEKEVRHDVKALEYFFREKLKETPLERLTPFTHIFLTSEDVTNLAYACMLDEAINKAYLPSLVKLDEKLMELADKYKSYPMLGKTHGQPAVPLTLGHFFNVYLDRFTNLTEKLAERKLPAKISGAVGTFNSFQIAYPEIDWLKYSENFVKKFGFKPCLITTQILPHDENSELLRDIVSVNQVLMNLNQDLWLYLSYGWLYLKPKEKEVGSSVMPQKVNPIDFENAEGNCKISSWILNGLANELQRSRLQRDLSGSTLQRWYGAGIGTSLLAIKRTLRGLQGIEANELELRKSLEKCPEVLMEALQTIGRIEGLEDIYERCKKFSRGKKRSLEEIRDFIKGFPFSKKNKEKLLILKPEDYVGLSEKLVEFGIENAKKRIEKVKRKIEEYKPPLEALSEEV